MDWTHLAVVCAPRLKTASIGASAVTQRDFLKEVALKVHGSGASQARLIVMSGELPK